MISTIETEVEHRFPIGTKVKYIHGHRVCEIQRLKFGLGTIVYELRYLDDGQVSIRPIPEVDNTFVEVKEV